MCAVNDLAVKLCSEHSLLLDEYERLINGRTPELAEKLAEEAAALRKRIYGNDVYVRGLIEISSYCKNDCFYCGIRRSNREAERYRLNPEERLGYGWQCWRTRAGWSMYGLGGQLAVVCPEKRALLTTIADTGLDGYGVQRIYDAFFEEIYPHIGEKPVEPVTLALQNRPLDNDAAFAVARAGEYRFPEGNALGLRRLSLSEGLLRYENARGSIELPFMPGADIEAPYPGWSGVPAIVKSGWAAPGLLRLRVHAAGDAPCGFDMLLCFTADGVTVQARRSYDPLTADYDGVTASV